MKIKSDVFEESEIHIEDLNKPIDKLESVHDNVMNGYDNSVLGKIRGIFCAKDSHSVNGRYYSEEFWDKVLNSKIVQNRFKQSAMIGTLEHPTKSKTRSNYHEGIITAYNPIYGGLVTKGIKFDGKYGYGDAYLLNTPVGNTILAYMLAKDDEGNNLFNIRPSSRGYSMEDYYVDGVDVMNPDDYDLKAWDLVFNPGVKLTTAEFEPRLKGESAEVLNEIIRSCHRDLCCNEFHRDMVKKQLKLKKFLKRISYE